MNIENKRDSVVYIPNEMNTNTNDKIWRSCCLEVSPHAIAYFGQFFVTLMVLGICAYMLIKANGDCNESTAYIGLISFVLGKILSSVIAST